jgi:hypothetical protein
MKLELTLLTGCFMPSSGPVSKNYWTKSNIIFIKKDLSFIHKDCFPAKNICLLYDLLSLTITS